MKKIKVLWCPVAGEPSIEAINNDLETMQEMVDGYIECVPLRKDIDLICNEEGLIRGMPLNKNRYPQMLGYPELAIYGNYFLCSHDIVGNFKSIPTNDLNRLLELEEELERQKQGYKK